MKLCVALCERSLVASARADWAPGRNPGRGARRAVRRPDRGELRNPSGCAMQAHAALRCNEITAACPAELTGAQRLRHRPDLRVPQFAVQARIELARCHLALSDIAAARILIREVDRGSRPAAGPGIFAAEAADLRARARPVPKVVPPRASALTAAELRLLPMLSTHLSMPEIAEELFLSPNTIKSQAVSIYRKLGASSRNQAVTRSRELGLLEG